MFQHDRQNSSDSVSATSQKEDTECSGSEEDSLLAAIGRDSQDEAFDLPITKRAKLIHGFAATSQPLHERLRAIVGHFASWMGVDQLSGLDMNILDNIMRMCFIGPKKQHNQIGVACRRLNVVWRRMKTPIVKKMFSVLLESCWPSNVINILDTIDIS